MNDDLAMFGIGLPGRPDAQAPSTLAWRLRTPDELPRGFHVADRYEVLDRMHSTAQVAVYRVRDANDGSVAKLKLYNPLAADEFAFREERILKELDHPGVPRALDSFDEDGRRCFVQTYVEGPTLREAFKEDGPLPLERLVPLFRSGLSVLVYLHDRDPFVLHRDIKPANMVVKADGSLALIDFGLARLGSPDVENEDIGDLSEAHTTGYAPPEQMIGLAACPASDVYALATSMVYAATNVHPIRLWNAQRGRVVVPAGLDPRLEELFNWLLAPALAERCPGAREALARLDEAFPA